MAGFGLQSHLDSLRSGSALRSAFAAQTLKEYAAWQAGLRADLQCLLGLEGRTPPPVAAGRLEAVEMGDYVEEKYCLDGGEGVQIELYLLVPRRPPPYRTVLVFHGHEPSVQYCLGHYPDVETEQAQLAIGNNYAQAFARAGYLVAAVEQRGFGERVTDDLRGGPFPRSCRHLELAYLLYGRNLLGERCWDGQRVIDYLLTRSDVIPGKIAVTGHSGGGATALWLAAIEPRLGAAAVSGYFSSFRSSIAAQAHCECNYVPGILGLAEMSDLAALIAPRPFCALNGEQDHLFPVQVARAAFDVVRRAYALHGAGDACHLAIHTGGHVYPQALSLSWLGDCFRSGQATTGKLAQSAG